MTIAYIDKVNQRVIGSELLIVNEAHIIGTTAVATSSPNTIRLYEVPLQESPSSVAIPGFTEVLGSPGTLEYRVDYTNGRITFNATQNGNTVFVTYKGRGSIIDAEDINEIQQVFKGSVTPGSPTIGIASLDGTLSAGIVRPSNISTVATDAFLFPQNVTITGDLTVNGTTTSINTSTVTIEDNIILLNSNVTGTPSFDAGIEVERGTSPNVQLVWNETDDAWSMKNTSGSAILEAFDTGVVSIPGTLSLGGPIKVGDGTVSSPAYSFTADTDTGIYRNGGNDMRIAAGGVNTAAFRISDILFNVPISVSDGTASAPSVAFQNSTNMGLYRVSSSVLGIATAGSERVRIDATGQVGINATPVATLHIGGSTLFGLVTATNPSSVTTSQVDSNSGIVITSSIAVSVTLASPTSSTQGRFFTVLHNDTSTGTLSVNGQSVGIGKGIPFMWDGTAWIPVGGSGGFNLTATNPVTPQTGDTWFNTTTSQFMGYNGSTNVILG